MNAELPKWRGSKKDKPDLPYMMELPNGASILVQIPADWYDYDVSGELMFRLPAVRKMDRVMVMAMELPPDPTPGYIRTLREALGLTQAQLGEKIGVDRMTVARWEWGKNKPAAAARKKLDKLRRDAIRRGVIISAA